MVRICDQKVRYDLFNIKRNWVAFSLSFIDLYCSRVESSPSSFPLATSRLFQRDESLLKQVVTIIFPYLSLLRSYMRENIFALLVELWPQLLEICNCQSMSKQVDCIFFGVGPSTRCRELRWLEEAVFILWHKGSLEVLWPLGIILQPG